MPLLWLLESVLRNGFQVVQRFQHLSQAYLFMSPRERINELTRQYIRNWSPASLPQIGVLLKQLSSDSGEQSGRKPTSRNDNDSTLNSSSSPDEPRCQLLTSLIAADIELRTSAGENISAADYASFDKHGQAIAQRIVKDQLSCFDESVETRGDDSASGSRYSPPPAEDRFGPYKLVERIGSGGMGIVWVAEQQEPVQRRVALKVIRREIGSDEAIARFESERRTIAMMNHPNIAQILDAGTSDSGNPYFVMGLVDGIPIDRYCDENQLTIRQRLELMLPVCRAVQHAHQKGIVHRDLKPSNVLVSETDGQPVPVIIDFGLAKALRSGNALSEHTMATAIGRVVGTLQYMSPEQAETGNQDIDTRSDIYSLGVLMYKLLTGTTPLDRQRLTDLKLLDAVRVIQEESAPRPWSRLSASSSTSNDVCELRSTTLSQLKLLLSGDLEWIVMKALEKELDQRYQTCNALAMDIQRHLSDEKVLARPSSGIYNLRKFVKRNRGLVASTIAIATLLVAGTVTTGIAGFWAFKERDRANATSEVAIVEAELARNAERAARDAEQDARQSEERRAKLQKLAEIRLYAMRMKSAWGDWQLGNAESAWQTLNHIQPEQCNWETRFLQQEFSASEHIYYGHALAVNALAVSADGNLAASVSADHTLQVWNVVDDRLLYRKMFDDELTDVCFSPDSAQLACSDLSNRITTLDPRSGEVTKVHGPFGQDISCLCFGADGNTLVAGQAGMDSVRTGATRKVNETGTPAIIIVSASGGEVLQELSEHTGKISSISAAANGNTIVSGSLDSSVRVWNLEGSEYQQGHVLKKHIGGVLGVAVSPSGERIASCGEDQTIRIWNSSDGILKRSLAGHNSEVNAVAWAPAGDRVVSAGAGSQVIVWGADGRQQSQYRGHYERVTDVSFSADGTRLFTASGDDTMRKWNSSRKPGTAIVAAHDETVWAIDINSDGTEAACSSEDGYVSIIDLASSSLIGKRISHVPECLELSWSIAALSVAISPDDKFIATGGSDAKVRIWNYETRELVATVGGEKTYVWDLTFSPDGKYLVSGNGKSAGVWNTNDWTLECRLEGHTAEIASVDFSPDGTKLVTASDDMKVKLWDMETFKLIHTFKDHKAPVWRAVFSPDGSLIASSSYTGLLIIWQAENYEPVHKIGAHKYQVAGLAFSPDGSRLITASDDRTIIVRDVSTGTELFVLRDSDDTCCVHVAFTPDGKQLVSGSSGGLVTIRTAVEPGNEIRPLLPQRAMEKTVEQLTSLVLGKLNQEQFLDELEEAEKWHAHHFSFGTLINLGIIQYRLGRFEEAIATLQEADRIERIQYGEPDMFPVIDCFLAMSLLKSGRTKEASQSRKLFTAKRNTVRWKGVEYVDVLWDECESTFKAEAR